MKKKILFTCLLSALLITMAVCGFKSVACPQSGGDTIIRRTGYYSAGVHYKMMAEALKCDCNPVNNHLKVFLRVQYPVGTHYYWEPVGDGLFKTAEDYNVSYVDVSITMDYPMNYGLGVYYKTCNGVLYDSHREWPQDAN